jgi:hypothetical protein
MPSRQRTDKFTWIYCKGIMNIFENLNIYFGTCRMIMTRAFQRTARRRPQ